MAKDAAEGALRAQTFIAEPSNERSASFLTCYARKYNMTKFLVPMAAAQGFGAVTFANPEDARHNLKLPSGSFVESATKKELRHLFLKCAG